MAVPCISIQQLAPLWRGFSLGRDIGRRLWRRTMGLSFEMLWSQIIRFVAVGAQLAVAVGAAAAITMLLNTWFPGCKWPPAG
jgi:hypothetical protein